jgi:hypothetical protein
MRSLLATIVCTALLAPGLASAQSLTPEQVAAFQAAPAHPAECARLRRQVDHYVSMQQRATTLRQPMWEERMGYQIQMLRAMQASRCPQDLPVDTTAEAFKQLLALAAKGALTYFTFGAAGF